MKIKTRRSVLTMGLTIGLAFGVSLSAIPIPCALSDSLDDLLKEENQRLRVFGVGEDAKRVDPSTNLGAVLERPEAPLKLLEWLVAYPWGNLKPVEKSSLLYEEFAYVRQKFVRGESLRISLEVLLPRPYYEPSISLGLIKDFNRLTKPQPHEKVVDVAAPIGERRWTVVEGDNGVCRMILQVAQSAVIVLTQDPCLESEETNKLILQLDVDRLEKKLRS